MNTWKITKDCFGKINLVKSLYLRPKLLHSYNTFVALTSHFLSTNLYLKKGYSYSTIFTFQRKAYASSVIARGLHLWKLSLAIYFPNCNILVFLPKSSPRIWRKQIVEENVFLEICQKNWQLPPITYCKIFERWKCLFISHEIPLNQYKT